MYGPVREPLEESARGRRHPAKDDEGGFMRDSAAATTPVVGAGGTGASYSRPPPTVRLTIVIGEG